MIDTVLAKIFGTKHDREVKAIRPLIGAINDLESRMEALSDEELAAQTVIFKEQLAQGATLDDLLVPAFATVREAGRRYSGRGSSPRRLHQIVVEPSENLDHYPIP